MTLIAALATVVGVFLGLSNLPQALKIFKTKSAKDISPTTFLIVEFGSLVWILYGLELGSIPIVLPNVLGFAMATLVLVGYFLYGRAKK